MIQLVTPANLKPGNLNTNLTDDCTDQNLSHVWTEYDDFPSSEDLSAFLADLERDALRREEGQALSALQSVKRNDPLSPVTPESLTTEIATLQDVCEISRASKAEDFTEFTDFPSSEDLDAFLADMELDCENIPVTKSLTPKTTVASAVFLNSKPHCKVESSKYLVDKEPVIKDTVSVDTGSTKPLGESHEDNIETEEAFCDMGIGTVSCCAQEEAKPPCSLNCSSLYDNDCSDSQFLRDCESVFSELTENNCHENRPGSKPNRNLLKSLLLSNQRKCISRNCRDDVNDISTKRSKLFCRSGRAEEFHEKDIVCNTPLRDIQTSIIRSRVRNANETEEDHQGNHTIGERLTSIDHHDNNEVSMLNDSCDVMSGTPFSPDLFSQSLSVMEECCSKTPDLFSSPRLANGESRCTEHSTTPELFSSPRRFGVHTRSCTKEELNSVSLFSSSECSYLSSASSLSTERRVSFPSPAHLAVCGNEAASHPNEGHCDVENKLNRNSFPLSFHSTPYCVPITSKMLSRAWTPLQVSPLLASAESNRCNDISLQGTPVLFSQLSNSSL